MITKTKISKSMNGKTNFEIVETFRQAKKNESWMKIAQRISASTKKYDSVNLKKIDVESKEGDTVVVLGKVLGSGNITKKVRVCALNFSESARKKLSENKSEMVSLVEEINKNPKMQGVKIIR